MPNSLQTPPTPPPATGRATNCSLSSITEHSFQGIIPSPLRGESVTYVSGTMCYLCLRPFNQALTPVEEFSRGHKKVQIPREASNSAHGSPITMFTFNACLTPAAASCASRLRVEASKSFITATSSKEAEFDTSTTLVICRLLEYLAW